MVYIYIIWWEKVFCKFRKLNWRPINFWFAQIAGTMTKQIQLMCSYLMTEIDWKDLGRTNLEEHIYHAIEFPCYGWIRNRAEDRLVDAEVLAMFEDSEPQRPVQKGPWRWKWSAESISVWPQNTCKTAGSLDFEPKPCFTGHTELRRTVSCLDAASVRVFGCAPHLDVGQWSTKRRVFMSFQCQVSFPERLLRYW